MSQRGVKLSLSELGRCGKELRCGRSFWIYLSLLEYTFLLSLTWGPARNNQSVLVQDMIDVMFIHSPKMCTIIYIYIYLFIDMCSLLSYHFQVSNLLHRGLLPCDSVTDRHLMARCIQGMSSVCPSGSCRPGVG